MLSARPDFKGWRTRIEEVVDDARHIIQSFTVDLTGSNTAGVRARKHSLCTYGWVGEISSLL
jgi:hypothetical protein